MIILGSIAPLGPSADTISDPKARISISLELSVFPGLDIVYGLRSRTDPASCVERCKTRASSAASRRLIDQLNP